MSRVRILSGELFQSMILDGGDGDGDGDGGDRSRSVRSVGHERAQARPSTTAQRRRARARRVAEQEARTQQRYEIARRRHEEHRRENEKRVQERLAENARRREAAFLGLYESVRAGHDLADRVEREMQLKDQNELNKARRKFEDWNENVHGRIQKDIAAKLSARSYRDINEARREDFQRFLDITNRKGALFRDIIIPHEYDPLAPNRRCIRARPGGMSDPMKRALERRREEGRMLAGTADEAPLGRTSDLPLEHWASGKIEATPHGFFARVMDRAPKGSERGSALSTSTSRIVFDHYDVATGKAAADAEFPRGKRTRPQTCSSPDHPLAAARRVGGEAAQAP